MTALPDDPLDPRRLAHLMSSAAAVVAPISVISALLFYFGYASSRAQYEVFGIDIDTVGLSTQDYVMRSPQPLLVPLLVLALTGVAVALAHAAVRRRIDAAVVGAGQPDQAAVDPVTVPVRDPATVPAPDPGTGPDTAAAVDAVLASRRLLARVQRWARAAVLGGQALLVAGVVLLFSYDRLREWGPYPLVSPLVLASGAAFAAYGLRIEMLLDRRVGPRTAPSMAMYLVLATSVFWATATLAQWSGRGSASYLAQHLEQLPSVILDTRERLFLTSPSPVETVLPPSAGQTFHYRYRHLRLLIQGHDRLFLVPDRWSASNSTIVVSMDESTRAQFQFENRPP